MAVLYTYYRAVQGGGLGFCVEIFLIPLKHLLLACYTPALFGLLCLTGANTNSLLCLVTQKILRLIASRCGLVSRFAFPAYITDKLLMLADSILKEEIGPYIDHAVAQLRDLNPRFYHRPPDFPARALEVILQSCPFASSFS